MSSPTIHLQHLPWPEAQVKQVREWLTQPAFEIFVSFLANQAATLTAEAGNALVDGSEPSKIEAEQKAAEARRYQAAWEIMIQFVDRTYTPPNSKILPRPITTKPE